MRRQLQKISLAGLFLLAGVHAQALDEVDGRYQIGTAQDLLDFAKVVNDGKPKANAVLTANIDLTGVEMPCIYLFEGNFDGQGFAIQNFNYVVSAGTQGFIGTLNGGTVKNMTIDGKIEAAYGPVGVVAKADKGAVVQNVHSAVDMDINASSHCGGIVGSLLDAWVDGCTYSGTFTLVSEKGDANGGIAGYTNVGKITNNLFSGKMVISQTVNHAGGILGYVNNSNFKGLRGNLSIGTVTPGTSGNLGAIVGNANSQTPKKQLTGNFWLEGTAPTGMSGVNAVETPAVNQAQLASGEVTFKLNAYNESPVWFQQIGTDAQPVRTGNAVVYEAGSYDCAGNPTSEITYSNTPSEAVHAPHDYDADGFCSVCGQLKKAEDGFYEIKSAKALAWVRDQVNAGVTPVDVRLVADLDLGGENWVPIGHDKKMYTGTFDGGFHTISNMTVDHAEPGAGLFGTVAAGTIKNLFIDASCSVKGMRYAGGLIGHTSGSKTVNIECVGVMCDVTCSDEAAGGIIGNANGGNICNMTKCFTTGNITAARDAACFSGWQGKGSTIKDCWSTSIVSGIQDDAHYLARYSNLNMVNCYCPYGTQGTHIEVDDVSSGKLTYLLNGSSFLNPIWFQNVGTDVYPTYDSTHGVVYYAGNDTYASLTDEASMKPFIQSVIAVEQTYVQETVACKALLDEYLVEVNKVAEIAEREAFMAAYAKLMESRKVVEASAVAYADFRKVCEAILAELEASTITGPLRDKLDRYLIDDIAAGEEFKNGSFLHIMTQHVLTNEELVAEQAFIEDLLKKAFAENYEAGSEITTLMQNALFEQGLEGWDNTCSTSLAVAHVDGVMTAIESWNSTFDVHQTLTGMKKGIYMLVANAAFRAGGDLYNPLYSAQLYLNDKVNYAMMQSEDVISKADAVDGENCHLTGDHVDYAYIMGEIEGWVPKGPIGCAYAFKGGRYVNHVAAEVTDGTLTIGIKNTGTGLEKDWTGFGQFRLFYLGTAEEASAELDKVLADYAARAATISAFVHSMAEDYAKYPNFAQGLKDELNAAVNAIPTASTGVAKMELAGKFSQLFVDIYACRQAYIAMVRTAENVNTIVQALFDKQFITEEEKTTVLNDYNAAWDAYVNGTVSATEAQAIVDKFNSNSIFPPYQNGVYQLSTAKDWQIFAMMVNAGASRLKAELCADIDFKGESFMPIGWNVNDDGISVNNTYVYKGVFDGKGHTLSNVVVDKPEAIGAGVFGSIATPAVIRNLRLDNTCAITGKDRAALVGRSTGGGHIWLENLGNEGTVTSGLAAAGILGNANDGNIAHLKNCYSTGKIAHTTGEAYKNCSQICGWFGSVGGSVENCWSISPVVGHDGLDKVFARTNNDKTVFTNCYSTMSISAQAQKIADEMVASGELTFNLNAGNTENPVWRQTLGEHADAHPVLDATHLIVYKLEDGTFSNDATGEAIEDVNAELGNIVNVYNVNGHLLRTAVPVSTALQGMPRGLYILKGDKGAARTIVK